MPNLDEIAKLITEKWELLLAIVVLLGGSGIYGAMYLEWQNRRKIDRLRQIPKGDFPFQVIQPRSPDLLKQIMGGDENNPLADYKIPYQERQPDRNIRKELEAAFTEKNWVLILGKSGLGKTREAAHLANLLNQEGWIVLKLVEQVGEWLDIPKEFPSEIRPDDKLLFFLDDLNRWVEPGNLHEIHPIAAEDLARPLREPVQERLERLLRYFETQCRAGYVRVIATARNEQEPDKPGYTAPWSKLQWEKYKSFWQQFHCYELVEPSQGAIVKLLTECVDEAGLRGVPEEYGQIARRNDGTFRNITLNLESAQSRGQAVNVEEFSPKLDETWRQKYNRVVRLYRLAVYAYDAVELLRTLNLALTVPMLEATTKRLLPGRGVRKWWQERQLRRVLRYLVTTEQILEPKDGQIEAKKTGAVDVERYLPTILRQIGQIAKQYPDYAAAECFYCGTTLYTLERYEGAIESYDEALKIKPDDHEAWYNRGTTLFNLGRYNEAIENYDEALRIRPDNYQAWNNRGSTLSRLGRYNEAIESYDEALKIKPDYHQAWNNRGSTLSRLGRYNEAIENYDEALKIKPNDHEAWYNRGTTLFNLGRYNEAIENYDEALKIKPNDHEAWYNRGLTLFNLGRYNEAIESYDEVLRIKLDTYEAWGNRGIALTALRRYEEALLSYNRVLEIKSDDNYAIYKKAACYSLQGNIQNAVETLQQAILLNSEYQKMAKTDSDFDLIRQDDRFQALLNSD